MSRCLFIDKLWVVRVRTARSEGEMRYILIDNQSGFIIGDTANVCGRELKLGTEDRDIIAACRAVDDELVAVVRRTPAEEE